LTGIHFVIPTFTKTFAGGVMKTYIKTTCILLLSLIFSSCDIESLFEPDESEYCYCESPYCEIINTEMDYPSFGFTKMKITVQNTGDGSTAFNIGCYIRLKKGSHIVDEATVYFGYLDYYESKTKEAVFTEIKSQSDYSYEEIKLRWYDSDGYSYEVKY
jgi:hypothetical protein